MRFVDRLMLLFRSLRGEDRSPEEHNQERLLAVDKRLDRLAAAREGFKRADRAMHHR